MVLNIHIKKTKAEASIAWSSISRNYIWKTRTFQVGEEYEAKAAQNRIGNTRTTEEVSTAEGQHLEETDTAGKYLPTVTQKKTKQMTSTNNIRDHIFREPTDTKKNSSENIMNNFALKVWKSTWNRQFSRKPQLSRQK